MFRKITAAFLISVSTASVAQPTSSQDLPAHYQDTIRKFSAKAKDIAKDIPPEQRAMYQNIMTQARDQKLNHCLRLSKSKIEQERSAGMKCLDKLKAEKSHQ